VLPNEIFSVAGAVRGSIASWQVGDFGYDASNPYNDAFKSGAGLSPDQAANLSKLVIAEDTPGSSISVIPFSTPESLLLPARGHFRT